MIKKTFEWLRVAYPKPDSVTVEARQKSVAEVLTRLDQTKTLELLAVCVTGSAVGLENRVTSQAAPVVALVESAKKFQSAFPGDISENALDLRVICALSLGELLVRDRKPGMKDGVLPAALLLSASGVRPAEGGKYVLEVLKDLATESWRVLDERAGRARERQTLDFEELDGIEAPSDAAVLWADLLPALKMCLTTLENQSRANEEELEVLSWFYNEASVTLQKPLRELPSHLAALVCGAEIADRVVLPPHRGVLHMIASAVSRGRTKKGELDEVAWADLAAVLDESARKLLIPAGEDVGRFVHQNAAILPVTWLAARLEESGGAAGWEAEFERKTALKVKQGMKPTAFAEQVFKERVAQRLLAEYYEE